LPTYPTNIPERKRERRRMRVRLTQETQSIQKKKRERKQIIEQKTIPKTQKLRKTN
jgi:hypothetical protein